MGGQEAADTMIVVPVRRGTQYWVLQDKTSGSCRRSRGYGQGRRGRIVAALGDIHWSGSMSMGRCLEEDHLGSFRLQEGLRHIDTRPRPLF